MFIDQLQAGTDMLCSKHTKGFQCSEDCQKVKEILKVLLKEDPKQRPTITDFKNYLHKLV